MATNPMNKVVQYLHRAALLRDGVALPDGQLLERYLRGQEEAAFAALVQRHGPMVWGVCRRVLGNHHDAEDAFPATFLVLVRKAASIRPREMVANWLYGVAHKTALKARATAAKRKERERQATEMPEPAVAEPDLWQALQPLLDQELSKLPDKYRAVIVLCDLEGKTRKQAARQLGVPEGTVAGWLARARALLVKRCARHRLALTGGALAAVLSKNAVAACVPTSVVFSTIKAATLCAAGPAAASGAISVQVAALTEGVLKAMLLTKLQTASVVLLVLLLSIGSGLLGMSAIGPKAAVAQDKKPDGAEVDAPKKGAVAGAPVLATDVVDVYRINDALADEKFTGKRLQVTGQMLGISRFENKYALAMKGVGPELWLDTKSLDRKELAVLKAAQEMRGVGPELWFEFDAKDRKELAALKAGQELTVQGQCEGKATVRVRGKIEEVIRFVNCEFVQAKRPPDQADEKRGAQQP
jgi:RNA polymerase sigma factor (sigma-70 family)